MFLLFVAFACDSTAQNDLTGKTLYNRTCMSCHKSSGDGTAIYPPLAGSEWVVGEPDILVRIILHGVVGEIEVKSKKYNSSMVPFGQSLSDKNIANLATFLRSSWGNSGSEITEQQVTKIREKYKARSKQWTAPELRGNN